MCREGYHGARMCMHASVHAVQQPIRNPVRLASISTPPVAGAARPVPYPGVWKPAVKFGPECCFGSAAQQQQEKAL